MYGVFTNKYLFPYNRPRFLPSSENLLQSIYECKGYIGFEERGNGGFGYDPLFMVGDKSFAELTPEEKDALSHRGNALRLLSEKLKDYFSQQ